MSEFKVIETQEQLNEVIKERLERERRTIEKQYEGYLSPEDISKQYEGYLSPEDVKKQYEGFLSPEDAAKKEAKLKEYELRSVKMQVAHETGLPYDSVKFLTGDDEESIKTSAESLKALVGTNKVPPLATTEPANQEESKTAAYKELLGNLKGE